VIGAKYVADQEKTELLGDYGTSLSKLRAKFDGYSVNYVDQTDDYQKMIVRMSAPYEPGGLYLYNRGDEMPSMLQNQYSNLESEEMGNVFSAGYGKSFEQAGRDNWLVMQEDVEDATRYLLSKGYADPNRTCIAGWSYGGYAALMGAAKDNDGLYDCVIAMAALTDIKAAKAAMKEYRGGRHAAKTFFGDAMKDSAVRKANSPVHVAGNIKVPVFIAHGRAIGDEFAFIHNPNSVRKFLC